MLESRAEQRNLYRGEPARAWVQAVLVARDGRRHALALVVDTGNPCEVIIDIATMLMMEWGEATDSHLNFGLVRGGWLASQFPKSGSTPHSSAMPTISWSRLLKVAIAGLPDLLGCLFSACWSTEPIRASFGSERRIRRAVHRRRRRGRFVVRGVPTLTNRPVAELRPRPPRHRPPPRRPAMLCRFISAARPGEKALAPSSAVGSKVPMTDGSPCRTWGVETNPWNPHRQNTNSHGYRTPCHCRSQRRSEMAAASTIRSIRQP